MTEADFKQHLDKAEKEPKLVAAAVSGLPDKALRYKPAPDKWSILEILAHLADVEIVYAHRIRQMLADEHPKIAPIDQDAWAKGLNYSRMPLELSRRIYEAVRAGIIYQARLHYDFNGHREFVHSETGVRTLKDEFEKVASHNEHHLEQIALALHNAAASGRD